MTPGRWQMKSAIIAIPTGNALATAFKRSCIAFGCIGDPTRFHRTFGSVAGASSKNRMTSRAGIT